MAGRSGAPGAAGIGPVPRHRYCAPTRAPNPGVGGGWRRDARKPEEHAFFLFQGTLVWTGRHPRKGGGVVQWKGISWEFHDSTALPRPRPTPPHPTLQGATRLIPALQEPGFSPANCSQRLPSIPASPQEPFQLALGLWGPLHRGASWNSLPVSAGTLGWLLQLKLPSRGGVLPPPHRHPDIPPKLEGTAPSDLGRSTPCPPPTYTHLTDGETEAQRAERGKSFWTPQANPVTLCLTNKTLLSLEEDGGRE